MSQKHLCILLFKNLTRVIGFSYRVCPEDFSETVQWIFVKFSGLIVSYENLIYFFLVLMTSLAVLNYSHFSDFQRVGLSFYVLLNE